jgi:hypothetical protein
VSVVSAGYDTIIKTQLVIHVGEKMLRVICKAVFRIRIMIHRIHVFLGLPDPDPLVIGMDPDPDPSIIKQI